MTIRKIAFVLVLAACHVLGGCATVENYCDERPAVCVGAGLAVGTAVLIVAVHKAGPPDVVVKQNPPPTH